MIRQLCKWVAARLPMAVIRRSDGQPYLFRYYIWQGRRYSLYLHHFVASDPDPELHDHPGKWAVGLILVGGYHEQRLRTTWAPYSNPWSLRSTTETVTRRLRPGQINVVRGADFHRVLLEPGKDAWTIFVRGPRVKDWGFLQPDGSKRVVVERLRSFAGQRV